MLPRPERAEGDGGGREKRTERDRHKVRKIHRGGETVRAREAGRGGGTKNRVKKINRIEPGRQRLDTDTQTRGGL